MVTSEIKILGLILSFGSLTASLGILSSMLEETTLSIISDLFFWVTAFLIIFFVYKISRSTSNFDFGKISMFPKFNKNYQKRNFRGFLIFSSLAVLLNGFIALQMPEFYMGAIMFFGACGIAINGFGFLFSILKPY